MAHNYILRVTAGSEYDVGKHQVVPVNESQHITIESEHIHAEVNVRIQSYRGLPRGSPSTSPYFELPPHDRNQDQYSIAFQFRLKNNINGNDLVFGNNFDHPVRDRLPPGFNTAFRIVKWLVDPGIDGDVYADKPYLYGPALSSINVLHVGGKEMAENTHKAGLLFEEGGAEEGLEIRKEKAVPDTEAGRKKHFLNEENRKEWEWEEGRVYGCDFFNPYLDFNEFALRLPGFTLPIMKYWDGQGLRAVQKRSHTLRYVLKDRATDTVLLVILFTLYLEEDIDEDGNIKEGAQGTKYLSPEEREMRDKATNGKTHNGHTTAENEKLPVNDDDDVD